MVKRSLLLIQTSTWETSYQQILFWDINCKYVSEFKVAWRKIKRRIWGLPYKAHNAIILNLSYNIDLQLDTRVLKFVHSCLTHCNSMRKSLLSAKFHCIKSTFAANYKYLSYKYKICQDDCFFMDINLLIGKMKYSLKKRLRVEVMLTP